MISKERILERTIAALDPRKDGAAIARLEAELKLISAVPSPDAAPGAPRDAGERGGVGRLTLADVAAYRALGAKEVHLRSAKWGDIFLVLEKTGGDRIEFTPEEIMELSQASAVLGGEIAGITKAPPMAGLEDRTDKPQPTIEKEVSDKKTG